MNRNILILICILLFAGAAHRTAACTCAESTVAQNVELATPVFVGTVTSKRKSDAIEKDGIEAVLKVGRRWKGEVSKTALVYTGATDDLYPFLNLCATPFRVGQKYVVFTYGRDKLVTDVCAGSAELSYARSVLKQLGRGKPLMKRRT